MWSKFWSLNKLLLVVLLVVTLVLFPGTLALEKELKYEPTWESLESRPLPAWFQEAKVGIFIHFGIYSVTGFGGYEDDYKNHYGEWFWNDWHYGTPDHLEFMRRSYPPNFTYQDFAAQFRGEFFDPAKWAETFQKAGAKYIVLTSKHHDGYSLYPSKYGFGWNSVDVGPKRDFVDQSVMDGLRNYQDKNFFGDLAAAIREKTDIKFGLYHSAFEWFNPLFQQDKENSFETDDFVQFKTLPELYEIVNLYQPEVIWGDGAGDANSDYWLAKEFIAWLYNESPVNSTVVTNDRWGSETMCQHGGYLTCTDNYNPGVLQPRYWENCMSLDRHSYGIRRNAKLEDYRTPEEVIKILVEVVSCGGNLLVNIGPTAEGVIETVQEERLMQLGDWLTLNGEAIYESIPWTVQNDTTTLGVWYTANPSRNQVYAITLNWPVDGQLHLGAVDESMVQGIKLIGSQNAITWTSASPNPGIIVNFPRMDENESKWAWTLVISQN